MRFISSALLFGVVRDLGTGLAGARVNPLDLTHLRREVVIVRAAFSAPGSAFMGSTATW
jgi:hypothetical protein